jgi:3-oxoadipate enol-lactonase
VTTIHSTSGFAPVHNGKLFYEVAGTGPVVLFIHAGVADHRMWDNQFELFSEDHRVIRYDTRGYGKSHTETTEFSNRQDIINLFDHLGVDKATVIGVSRGGQIAIDFTLEHPERVSALVPVASGLGGYEYQPDDSEHARRENDIFTHMDELWEKKAFDELAELEVHVWADGPVQPHGRAPDHIRDYMHQVVRENYIRQEGEVTVITLAPPAASRLSEIHVPTLILVGEYDTLGTLATANKLERDIPEARKVVFHDTAHMLPMEQPAQFNEMVLAFLKSEA